MSWLSAAEETPVGASGTWLALKAHKDSAVIMLLDAVPAVVDKKTTDMVTGAEKIKQVWCAQVLDTSTNEVRLWDISPKLLVNSIGPDLEGTDPTKVVYRLTRFGQPRDPQTTYKIKVERQMEKLDELNYRHAQGARKDLASIYLKVVKPAKIPPGFGLDETGGAIPF